MKILDTYFEEARSSRQRRIRATWGPFHDTPLLLRAAVPSLQCVPSRIAANLEMHTLKQHFSAIDGSPPLVTLQPCGQHSTGIRTIVPNADESYCFAVQSPMTCVLHDVAAFEKDGGELDPVVSFDLPSVRQSTRISSANFLGESSTVCVTFERGASRVEFYDLEYVDEHRPRPKHAMPLRHKEDDAEVCVSENVPISPTTVLVACGDGEVRLCDTRMQAPVSCFKDVHARAVFGAVQSGIGSALTAICGVTTPSTFLVATGNVDGGIRLWDLRVRSAPALHAPSLPANGAVLSLHATSAHPQQLVVRRARSVASYVQSSDQTALSCRGQHFLPHSTHISLSASACRPKSFLYDAGRSVCTLISPITSGQEPSSVVRFCVSYLTDAHGTQPRSSETDIHRGDFEFADSIAKKHRTEVHQLPTELPWSTMCCHLSEGPAPEVVNATACMVLRNAGPFRLVFGDSIGGLHTL